MNVDYTDEQLMLRDSVARRFGPKGDLCALSPEERWQEYAEAGLLGMAFPEELGGLGAGAVESMVFMEEAGKALRPDAYVSAVVHAGELLRQSLPQARAAEAIEGVIDGSLRLAVMSAFDPPAAGGLALAPRGAGFVVRGEVALVEDGAQATHFIVFVPAGEEAAALAVVAADAPGLTVHPRTGWDGRRHAQVTLADVHVPPEDVLLRGERAVEATSAGWDFCTMAACARAVGAMATALALTVDYVGTRRQFKLPLSGFQVIRHRVVDMMMTLELSRSAVMAAASACQHGSRQAREVAVSRAKLQINRAARSLSQEAVQIHGAIGLTKEYQLGDAFKLLTTVTQLYGDDRFHVGRLIAHGDAAPPPVAAPAPRSPSLTLVK